MPAKEESSTRPMLRQQRFNTVTILQLMPVLVAVLAAIGACIGATANGLPLPFAVVGVFLVLGMATAWIARRTPLWGALFLLVFSGVVLAVIYAG